MGFWLGGHNRRLMREAFLHLMCAEVRIWSELEKPHTARKRKCKNLKYITAWRKCKCFASNKRNGLRVRVYPPDLNVYWSLFYSFFLSWPLPFLPLPLPLFFFFSLLACSSSSISSSALPLSFFSISLSRVYRFLVSLLSCERRGEEVRSRGSAIPRFLVPVPPHWRRPSRRHKKDSFGLTSWTSSPPRSFVSS